MNKSLPWQHKAALTEDRLNTIARAFLEVHNGVIERLSTSDDCNYTRGATFFGRCRNRLISMAQSSSYPWLTLGAGGMDITCEISGVPFRFFRDDHESPKKKGFWRRNASDQLFAPDDETPVIFRFIVERPVNDENDPEIYFVGYNSTEIAVTEWRYGQVVVLQSLDETIPAAVEQQPAHIGVRNDENDRQSDTGTMK
ncbi:hypothetical protein ACFONG_10245 [Uliginosibacterium paludis]|uniref:Uncharacterized protein n=1 Tax=Uliginosibacterium paludis TaxID=1615952 RepID=A0ABV2CML0_9RHOO